MFAMKVGNVIDGKLIFFQLFRLWANRFQFPTFFIPPQPDRSFTVYPVLKIVKSAARDRKGMPELRREQA